MGFYLVIFKKSLSTKNQDIKYNHLITNILHSIKIIYFIKIPIPHLSYSKVKKRRVPNLIVSA